MDALDGIFLAFVGQVEVQPGGFEPRMSHIPLNGPEIDTGFEQRRSIAVAEGMNADLAFHDASAVLGFAAGTLDAAAIHGFGGGCHVLLITSSGGKKPGRMAGCCPVVS